MSSYSNLSKRSIVPLHSSVQQIQRCRAPQNPGIPQLPDLSDIQGDIFYVFPKVAEQFMFFSIKDVSAFKKNLGSFTPTSSINVSEILEKINQAKETARNNRTPLCQVDTSLSQIAFSRAGLNFLGVKELTKDTNFDKGPMKLDRQSLGDNASWEKVFEDGSSHGVFTIAANSTLNCQKKALEIENAFKSSIIILHRENGQVLPNHVEHFGFRDGISQPAIKGLAAPHPGQTVVDPGIIIMGCTGDPIAGRPAWTKYGSMMVFRKLAQDVPGFNNYLASHSEDWRKILPQANLTTPAEGSAWFGARCFGRWKSGAPIQLAPYRDDPALGEDNERNNNFDYTVPRLSEPNEYFCPFNAHIRKTAPRNLLNYRPNKQELADSSIVRAGIPYGPQLTPTCPQNAERGLLFVCYQSSIKGGFLLQTQWALDSSFPVVGTSIKDHGQDPILGVAPAAPGFKPQSFVTSKGGEYFFVPAISTIKKWASATGC
ncbi:hypothetical protein H0H81_000944 [Sphagnurus paluster]|uniref:DyP dimeric alpha+beta barrel domain-containing protein n=1 Tax=Sphagnurus paluster TaxID=117069 RepID=A0A9P7K3B1_9AGAR|nr:hypothetical protein H0H81_000944 [Sphagnurus paluster]